MKNPEEVTRKILTKRKRRRRSRQQPPSSSKSTLSVPLDVVSEILSQLPAKSILRFRCVSKLWSSITTEPYFKKSFETHQSSTRPTLLVCFKGGDELFVFSLSQQNQNRNDSCSFSSSQPIDSYHMNMTNPKHHCLFSTAKTESVHGLMICFDKSANPIVWNPTMRRFRPLPKLLERSEKDITVLLGYDPIEEKHKVLCMPLDKTIQDCRVLTLGSVPEVWRRIETNHNHCPVTGNITGSYGRCINGVLYYHAELGYDLVIMRFDVRTEKLDVVTLPLGKSWRMMMMISYEGKLAFVGSSKSGKSISIWVLEDATKHEWSNHFNAPLSHYGLNYQDQTIKLIGITDDGELIYAPETLLRSFEIIYIDPKRQTFRRVKYRGIADDEFRRRNGRKPSPYEFEKEKLWKQTPDGERPINIRLYRLHGLQFFPNHSETWTGNCG